MSFKVIENANPKVKDSHQLIVDALFILRRYDISIHQVTSTFFHIRKGTETIGFRQDQLIAIDFAFEYIGVYLPFRLKGLIERRYRHFAEQRRLCNGY